MRALAPLLNGSGHKGGGGRIGLVGGSKEYTGAPFYAGMASLRAGAELVYLMTAAEAAGPIKAYSPELMVTPVYSHRRIASDEEAEAGAERTELTARIVALLPRLHALVVGPGLGRDAAVLDGVGAAIAAARERGLPIVLDADGLWLVALRPELVAGYRWAVLTPNAREYARLAKTVVGDAAAPVAALCAALGGVTIVHKGAADVVSNGVVTRRCEHPGAPRRCGGLGDLLAGSIGAFAAWAKQAEASGRMLGGAGALVFACEAACLLLRSAAAAAYCERKRSMTAPDVLDAIGACFDELCPAPLEAAAVHR